MQQRLNDQKLLIYGPPVHFVAITIFFNLSPLLDKETPLIRFLAFGLVSIYVTWLVARIMVKGVRAYFRGLEHYKKRILALVLLSVPAVGILVVFRIVCLMYWVFTDIGDFKVSVDEILFMLGINLFHLVVILSIYESRYFFSQWLIARSEAEQLLRTNLEVQLDSLKSQVQPHFLFNSLNTLQALVKTAENKKAISFINDLSQVYRYLL